MSVLIDRSCVAALLRRAPQHAIPRIGSTAAPYLETLIGTGRRSPERPRASRRAVTVRLSRSSPRSRYRANRARRLQ
jgi:hypothetical protein